jgi:glycosyltransferase involved in cell wall biosynthesis
LEELILSAHQFDDNVVLVVIGDQNAYYRDVLLPLWLSEGLQGRVFFLPYMEHDIIMPYIASADLGVVIYKNINRNNYLCAPTKLYEYFMANVPVVVCDFPEMRTMLDEYPVGLTFNPDDPASIAGAINAFFVTEQKRQAQINHYLTLARERFNWENEEEIFLGVFRSLEAEARE